MNNNYFLHDATPTWAGYNHQGSCGLLVAIKNITKLLTGNVEDISKLERFSIEFEGMEDFSIIKDKQYIEIHQVKNYKKSGFGKYKDAIWLLLAKTQMIPTIESSFLHLTHDITDFSVNNRTEVFDKFRGYVKPTNITGNQRDNEYYTPRECYEYFDNKYTENKNKYDELSDTYKEAFDKFHIYPYEEEKYFCNDTTIIEKIKDAIKEFLILIEETVTDSRIIRVYNSLKANLDKNIAKRSEVLKNRDIKDKYFRKEINFIVIYNLLKENLDTMSLEAVSYKEKEKLYMAIDDYYLDIEDSPDSKEIYIKQKEIVDKINSLNVKELVQQFIYMNPNIQINEADTSSMDLPDREKIKNTIIEMFAQIEKEISYDNFVYIEEEDTYKPTTITSKRHRSVMKAIVENTNKEMFSTYKYYITEALTHDINTDPDVTRYDTDDDKNIDNITKRNWPKLIKLEEAKEKLN